MLKSDKPLEGIDYTIINHQPCGFTIIHHSEKSKRHFSRLTMKLIRAVAQSKGLPTTNSTASKRSS